MVKAVMFIFALLGAANVLAGFMLCFKHVIEIIEKKKSSAAWIWVYIVISALGWFALSQVIKTA